MQKNIDKLGAISRDASPEPTPKRPEPIQRNLPKRPATQLVASRTFDQRTFDNIEEEDVYRPVRHRGSVCMEQNRSAHSASTNGSRRDPKKVRAVEDSLKAL